MRYYKTLLNCLILIALSEILLNEDLSAQKNQFEPYSLQNERIFIVEHSHSDIAWSYNIEGEAQTRNSNLDAVFNMMRKDSTFRWTIECVLYFQDWLSKHPDKESEIIKYLSEKRLDCGATYTQPLEDCQYNELLVRQMYSGKRWFEKRYPDIKLNIVCNQDAPLRGLQTQQVYSKAGIKYLKASRMITPDYFYWKSPDGSKLLSWYQEGYWGKPKIDSTYIANQIQRLLENCKKFSQPKVVAMTWGHDYNDPKDFSSVIKKWNNIAPVNKLPLVSYGTFSDVLTEVDNKNQKLEEINGGVPNWWVYEEWPTHNMAMQYQRMAGKYLPMAEMFSTIKALLGESFSGYPYDKLNNAWTDATFACHTMVPSPNPAPDSIMLEKYKNSAKTGMQETQAAMNWIAQKIKVKNKGIPVVVFNGLAWSRTDPVEISLPENTGINSVLIDEQGNEIPFQILKNIRLVFIATNVPSAGYKTYYLTSGRTDKVSSTQPLPGSKWTTPFESDYFRVSAVPGGIKSIFDKESGKELLKTDRWLGGEWTTFYTKARGASEEIDFEPKPDVFSDRAKNHQSEWVCEESGPVLAKWNMTTINSKHCNVKTSVTVYRHIKRIDWTIDVIGNDKDINIEQRIVFPFNITNSQIAYEVPFGVIKAGESEPFVYINKFLFSKPPSLPFFPREIQNWVSVTGDNIGITIGSSVGACAFKDFGNDADTLMPLISPILLANVRNPDGKNIVQPGNHSFSFSLFCNPAGDINGSKNGVQSQNPLIGIALNNSGNKEILPEKLSFFQFDSEFAGLSTIKKAEDDNEVIMRVYNLSGTDSNVGVHSYFDINNAQKTDIIELNGKNIQAEKRSFNISLPGWSIETVKLNLTNK